MLRSKYLSTIPNMFHLHMNEFNVKSSNIHLINTRLMTIIFDSGVKPWGKIRQQSLLGVRGLILLTMSLIYIKKELHNKTSLDAYIYYLHVST